MFNLCAYRCYGGIMLGLMVFIVRHSSTAEKLATDTLAAAATVDYDAFDTISSELHDLDTEQSEARYDPRILSRELLGTVQHRSGGRALDETNDGNDDDDEQSETATGGGAHCIVNADRRYEHGDKIQRNDPCEICLCVDGEVFCWWKKCAEHKKHPKKLSHHNGGARKGNGRRGKHHHHRQSKIASKHHNEHSRNHDEVEMKSTPLYRRYQPSPQRMDDAAIEPKPQQKSMTRVVTPTKNKLRKNVLSLPPPPPPKQSPKQHMPVIMDLNVNEMDANDEDLGDSIHTPTYTSTPHQSPQNVQQAATTITITATSAAAAASTASRLPKNVLNSNGPIIGDDSHNNLVLNDKVTSISVIEPNDTARKLFIGTMAGPSTPTNSINNNNNLTKPVILVDDKLLNTMDDAVDGSTSSGINGVSGPQHDDDANSEKGYFEKTIINKNGVFIENIRKITNIDQRILGTSDITTTKQKPNGGLISSTSGMDIDNYDGSDDMDDTDNDNGDDITTVNGGASTPILSMDNLNGKINSKSIELMNNVPVAHAQHYVITSSGKIEKTDAMASDDGIAQYQGGSNPVANNNKMNGRQPQLQQQYTHQTVQPQSDGNFAASSATVPILSPHIETFTGGNLLTTTNSVSSSEPSSACIVMGKSYNIGTVLPQEAGNCLQCVCVKGANGGDPPKVTCSPHNCPPLILPDLFDSTGY